MAKCPACLRDSDPDGFGALSAHFLHQAGASDPDHVRWLNQNIGRAPLPAAELADRLRSTFELADGGLERWMKRRFIAKFFGRPPHPFVTALQRPSRAVLLGYVVEHQHFLRQWVRSCAYIVAHTDAPEVVRYELDNLVTEFGGTEHAVSHYELLLRMGESLGVPRARVLSTPPLPATARAIREWDRIAARDHWVEAMAAMHGLELIAHRGLVDEGASVHYFDPEILHGEAISPESQAFLREGYEADVGHSEEALALVARFAPLVGKTQSTQASFLRSIDLFDDYLVSRLERSAEFER